MKRWSLGRNIDWLKALRHECIIRTVWLESAPLGDIDFKRHESINWKNDLCQCKMQIAFREGMFP